MPQKSFINFKDFWKKAVNRLIEKNLITYQDRKSSIIGKSALVAWQGLDLLHCFIYSVDCGCYNSQMNTELSFTRCNTRDWVWSSSVRCLGRTDHWPGPGRVPPLPPESVQCRERGRRVMGGVARQTSVLRVRMMTQQVNLTRPCVR